EGAGEEEAAVQALREIVEDGVVLGEDRLPEVDLLAGRILSLRLGLPDDVAEVAGRSRERSGGEARRIHHGEGRVGGMVVGEIHSRVAKGDQIRRVGTDEVGAQTVPDEHDDGAGRTSAGTAI